MKRIEQINVSNSKRKLLVTNIDGTQDIYDFDYLELIDGK